MQQQDAMMYEKMSVDEVKKVILLENKQSLKEKKIIFRKTSKLTRFSVEFNACFELPLDLSFISIFLEYYACT